MRREERIVRRNLSLHGAGAESRKGIEFENLVWELIAEL
jgi:hypothetical protein